MNVCVRGGLVVRKMAARSPIAFPGNAKHVNLPGFRLASSMSTLGVAGFNVDAEP